MECDNTAPNDDSLESLGNIRAIVAKLPIQLQDRWSRSCASNKARGFKPLLSDMFGREALKSFIRHNK